MPQSLALGQTPAAAPSGNQLDFSIAANLIWLVLGID